MQDGRCLFTKGSRLPIEGSRNCKVQLDGTMESGIAIYKRLESSLPISVATNEGIRFLESRKDCHESPTQDIINVVETMKIPLTGLKDIFIDLGRDDIVRMLNLEISPNLQDGRCRFMKGSPLPIEDSRNCKVQVDGTIVCIIAIYKRLQGSRRISRSWKQRYKILG